MKLTKNEELFKQDLINAEERHGGLRRVKGGVKSPLDPRDTHPTMVGGDRMSEHGYADFYAKHLIQYLGKQIVLVEFGVLNGTGLKIWRDIFPTSRIIGFDIDLSNLDPGVSNHVAEVYELDQFKDNREYIGEVLARDDRGVVKMDKVDIVIDDGCHVDEAIMMSYNSIVPYTRRNHLYFVEDNTTFRERGLLRVKAFDGRITLF